MPPISVPDQISADTGTAKRKSGAAASTSAAFPDIRNTCTSAGHINTRAAFS
ncbi:hypothetical protein OG552_31505 [Streptomyces sp. NBC_01476]|uniref:hypothetical protein n=1 Tax=Streptomyces sp. NBC_01476 TaxID=2903881 RepID=UPI002E2F4711|nr:hypothetical protein [Streptomyces sp. NBC_01476]